MNLRNRLPSHTTVVAYLAFFIALATGGAYAANTVFSSDIVDGQVKTADLDNGAVAAAKLADGAITGDKIKDDSIQSRDVLDNNLKGVDIDESTLSNIGGGGPAGGDLTGTYPNPQIKADAVTGNEIDAGQVTLGAEGGDVAGTLAVPLMRPETIGALELEETAFFENESLPMEDAPGGGPTELELVDSSYDVTARCTDSGGGAVAAEILTSGTGVNVVAMSSSAPQGVADVTGLDDDTFAKMIGVGPTIDSHWRAGTYSIQGVVVATDNVFSPMSGVVAAGTHIEGHDCVFGLTGIG